jgi:hypothetical protein
VAEVQVTRWRQIPSLVVARDGDDEVVKIQLPARFQEAIDEAAMRLSAVDAEAYLEGWARDPWVTVAGSVSEAAEATAADLEAHWTDQVIADLIASLGPDS